MKENINYVFQITIIVFASLFIVSCVPVKEVSYFNDIDQLQEPDINPRVQKIILPFDVLYIQLYSIDENATRLFNTNDNMSSNESSGTKGYIVNEKGNINYPYVGNIHVSGLTLEQAKVEIEESLSEYVSNVDVTVKFIDNKVVVLGEVQSQGSYTFSQDKITIYEALALGGGISKYGNRKNVILIRQEGDKIMHHKLNLSDSRVAGKDLYYIQSNDIVVVEPLKSSSWHNYNYSVYSIIISSFTTLLAIYVTFFQK